VIVGFTDGTIDDIKVGKSDGYTVGEVGDNVGRDDGPREYSQLHLA
jgi:hypothetical protein